MSKRCPHCDGEIMPSVVKCRHCGKNVNDPVESRPDASQPAGVGGVRTADGDAKESGASPVSPAIEAALDPAAPPAGIAFRPSVAVTPIQAASSAPPTPPTPPAAARPPAASAPAASGTGSQDWGSPVEGKTGADPYWQVKTIAPTAALGVPARPKIDPKAATSAVVLLAAGAVAVFASLQPWIDASSNGLKEVADEVTRGFSGWAGKVTVAFGVACVILALMSFVRRSAGPVKVGLVAGLGIVAVGAYTVLTAASQIQATLVAGREVEGMREDAARGLVAGWLDSGALKVTPQTWLYVAIGTGVIATIGGLVAMSVKTPSTPRAGKSQLPGL